MNDEYTATAGKVFFSTGLKLFSECAVVLLGRHERQAVDLGFLVAHINAFAVAFEAMIVCTDPDLAGPDAGDGFLEAALSGRLAECVAHGIVQVANCDGQRVALLVGVVSTLDDFTAFDSCHFHNGTSGERFFALVSVFK